MGNKNLAARLRAREIKAKEITKSQCDLPSNLDWQIMSASSEFHYQCTMGFWEIDAPEKIQPPPCDDSDELIESLVQCCREPTAGGWPLSRKVCQWRADARRAESGSRVCGLRGGACRRPRAGRRYR